MFMELLVPAGDINSFYVALNNGADAVYLSGKVFGARSYAKNFTIEELKTVLRLGKIYGVKIYVTMNTWVKENEVEIVTVNNQEESAYLGKVATEEQLGRKTYSCAYVEPTTEGSGINVKSANITWVTSSMVATTLSTAGLTGANWVIAAVFPVSGTSICI